MPLNRTRPHDVEGSIEYKGRPLPPLPVLHVVPPLYTLHTRSDRMHGNATPILDLYWQRAPGFSDGIMDKADVNPIRIGTDWDFTEILHGPEGSFYAIKADGEVLWYWHHGFDDGAPGFSGPKTVRTKYAGFRVARHNVEPSDYIGMFADTQYLAPANERTGAILYGVRPNGELCWHKHLGFRDGSAEWDGINVGDPPRVVACGDASGFRHVFSGSNGILYWMDVKGRLFWQRHLGYLTGAPECTARVPTSFQVSPEALGALFSPGGGVIYRMQLDGALYWYWYRGYTDGINGWKGSVRVCEGRIGGASFVLENRVDLRLENLG